MCVIGHRRPRDSIKVKESRSRLSCCLLSTTRWMLALKRGVHKTWRRRQALPERDRKGYNTNNRRIYRCLTILACSSFSGSTHWRHPVPPKCARVLHQNGEVFGSINRGGARCRRSVWLVRTIPSVGSDPRVWCTPSTVGCVLLTLMLVTLQPSTLVTTAVSCE